MDMREINEGVISEFRGADGQLSGPMAGAPILLLTTIGRRTGNPHTNPLGFIDVGGRLVVAGANGERIGIPTGTSISNARTRSPSRFRVRRSRQPRPS